MYHFNLLKFVVWGLFGVLLSLAFGFYIYTWEFWMLLLAAVVLTTVERES